MRLRALLGGWIGNRRKTKDMVNLAETLGLDVIEAIEEPGRREVREPLPDRIARGPLAPFIDELAGGGGSSLWRHQSLALGHVCEGRNVVVATGTASGKSEIFQIAALARILADRDNRVLVFYPQKSLVADQLNRWSRLAETCNLPEGTVARIDGSIRPLSERLRLLMQSRIALMTPDVCHSWLMRGAGKPAIMEFLRNLVLVVLDEAHVYESVFGSNKAFLLRRLIAAKHRASGGGSPPPQFIATTATLSGPGEHLRRLTGLEFIPVEERDNGSPHFGRRILHVDDEMENGRSGESAMQDVLEKVLRLSNPVRFIAFHDSRQGVERVVRTMGNPQCLPYRGGYHPEDRSGIERALRENRLRGVVSTSALELGIDIPDMGLGMTLGMPQSRKVLRQRIGRIGRRAAGLFMVMAPRDAFRRLGMTFGEYCRGEAEPSHLYLGNRFVQFAHARCLREEMASSGREAVDPPLRKIWPEEFRGIAAQAGTGTRRSPEFDEIANMGGSAPHFNYPLRQIGETNFRIDRGNGEGRNEIGSISLRQAIREAYPGAVYLHLGRAYRVEEWTSDGGSWNSPSIRVSETNTDLRTKPMQRRYVTVSLEHGVVEGRFMENATGLLAEVHVRVRQSVEGYTIADKPFLYDDLKRENPCMCSQSHDFTTTGVMLRIREDWFSGPRDDAASAWVRRRVAGGLRHLLLEGMSIAAQDVEAISTDITLLTGAGSQQLADCVIIYDSVYGGLRLTEAIFDKFSEYVSRLRRGVDLAGEKAIVSDGIVRRLETWSKSLEAAGDMEANRDMLIKDARYQGSGPHAAVREEDAEMVEQAYSQSNAGRTEEAREAVAPEGWMRVHEPGSVVFAVSRNNERVQYELIEPCMQYGELWYRCRTVGAGPSVDEHVPHRVVRTAHDDRSWCCGIRGRANTGSPGEKDRCPPMSASKSIWTS